MDTVHLAPPDNIVVLARNVTGGEKLRIGEQEFPAPDDLQLGHKLAARDISAGEKILKYGAPIGSATVNIPAGAHVHLHNMKSDYLPTFTLEEGRQFLHA